MSRNDFYQAVGNRKVFWIGFMVGEAITASSSNYHTFTLRIVRDGQDTGETIDSATNPYSTSNRTLVANTPITLYDDPAGLAMSDGERLALFIDETGTPTTLERCYAGVEDNAL